MKSLTKTIAIASVVTLAFCASTTTATAGNGWGWAKPLNQKPGSILYTTQRKAKPRYHSSSRRIYNAPSYRPAVTSRNVYPSPVVGHQAVGHPAITVPGPAFTYPTATVHPSVNHYPAPQVVIPHYQVQPIQIYRSF